jgi:signal peptide peptidase SppA
VVILLTGFIVIVVVFLLCAFFLYRLNDGLALFEKKVAVVEIDGAIYDVDEWKELLEDCADSRTISAVVLHINSPGGAITPVQELFDACRKIKAEEKPIIAAMASVAASGGYYLACAAEEIFAMSGTLTGSIGVYMQTINLSDLLQKLGVEFETIKKGAFKTAGDYAREMNGYERAMFQAVVDDYYNQFLDAVTDSRSRNRISLARGWNEPVPGGIVPEGTSTVSVGSTHHSLVSMPGALGSVVPGLPSSVVLSATETGESSDLAALTSATVEAVLSSAKTDTDRLAQLFAEGLSTEAIRKRVALLAEGRIYTGRQALAVGLIDQIGSLQDAIDRAGELSGLGKDPKTVTKKVDESGGLFSLKALMKNFATSRFLYYCPYGG